MKCPKCGSLNYSEVDTDWWSSSICKDCKYQKFEDFETPVKKDAEEKSVTKKSVTKKSVTKKSVTKKVSETVYWGKLF